MLCQHTILWQKRQPLVFCWNRSGCQWAPRPLQSVCSPRVSKGPVEGLKHWGKFWPGSQQSERWNDVCVKSMDRSFLPSFSCSYYCSFLAVPLKYPGCSCSSPLVLAFSSVWEFAFPLCSHSPHPQCLTLCWNVTFLVNPSLTTL